jgi:hypothetical protein
MGVPPKELLLLFERNFRAHPTHEPDDQRSSQRHVEAIHIAVAAGQ